MIPQYKIILDGATPYGTDQCHIYFDTLEEAMDAYQKFCDPSLVHPSKKPFYLDFKKKPHRRVTLNLVLGFFERNTDDSIDEASESGPPFTRYMGEVSRIPDESSRPQDEPLDEAEQDFRS